MAVFRGFSSILKSVLCALVVCFAFVNSAEAYSDPRKFDGNGGVTSTGATYIEQTCSATSCPIPAAPAPTNTWSKNYRDCGKNFTREGCTCLGWSLVSGDAAKDNVITNLDDTSLYTVRALYAAWSCESSGSGGSGESGESGGTENPTDPDACPTELGYKPAVIENIIKGEAGYSVCFGIGSCKNTNAFTIDFNKDTSGSVKTDATKKKGVLTIQPKCATYTGTKSLSEGTIVNDADVQSSGNACFCHVTKYVDSSGVTRYNNSSNPSWVYRTNISSCASGSMSCAYYCARDIGYYTASNGTFGNFRLGVIGSADSVPGFLYSTTVTTTTNGETVPQTCSPQLYSILYYVDGSQNRNLSPLWYSVDDYGNALPAVTKNDYTFAGWCETDANCNNPTQIIPDTWTGNKTLYAKFTANEPEIPSVVSNIDYKYNDYNGDLIQNSSCSVGENFNLLNGTESGFPQREGYIFMGWKHAAP